MWDKATYDNFLQALTDNNASKIATWLSHLLDNPCENPSILPRLETLLSDKRIASLSQPTAYGEIRWAAALALVNERGVQNEGAPLVVLENSFFPMGVPDILVLIADSSFTLPSGLEWAYKLEGIRDGGNLDLATYEFRFGEEPRKL